MGLSHVIDSIIEENYEAIVNSIPFKDILIDLRTKRILTDVEVNQLNLHKSHRDTGFNVIQILKARTDVDFFQFCNVLKSSTIKHVQLLGRRLENTANEKGQAQGESYSCVTLC